ncbi:hypothetical protein [Caballeronia sp. BR00000012568055]|uniref:hypothetical protein n=1 Tax=Caballeronia sp. BR00000012568055 TaxID=2918761 RepID=UPI0023F66CEF|nr:hypothetical protein [Caballeronia sp. BR00000012568055]
MKVAFTIHGQPYSKANSRAIVTHRYRALDGQVREHPRSIKPQDALAFERAALLQIPVECRKRLTGPVRVTLRIYYASNRPDLDESLILDVLQDRYAWRKTTTGKVRVLIQAGVCRNDRAVWEKHVLKALDKTNPRAEIIVEPLSAQQCELWCDHG